MFCRQNHKNEVKRVDQTLILNERQQFLLKTIYETVDSIASEFAIGLSLGKKNRYMAERFGRHAFDFDRCLCTWFLSL